LKALAATHDVLTQHNWEKASLHEVVRSACSACGVDSKRFEASGPDVTLQPSQAVTIAMALHELCTNAVKYGALSSDRGRVSVQWTVDASAEQRRIQLTWTERDGPPVAPPQREGFGTRMIKSALAADLQGTALLQYDPEGLICVVDGRLSA
jgi:two-component sensor histidine kinase